MRLSFKKCWVIALCNLLTSLPMGAQPTAGYAAINSTGPGVHGANSPFKPLVERPDVVSWKILSDVKIDMVKGRAVPTYKTTQLALNQKVQRVQGFILPLQPGEKQGHFLLSAVPPRL